jgi:hypothetical protein
MGGSVGVHHLPIVLYVDDGPASRGGFVEAFAKLSDVAFAVIAVALHIADSPALGIRFVKSLVELADVGLAAVGELAVGGGVVDDHGEVRALAGGGPFEHLKVTVGVAEGGDTIPRRSSVVGVC